MASKKSHPEEIIGPMIRLAFRVACLAALAPSCWAFLAAAEGSMPCETASASDASIALFLATSTCIDLILYVYSFTPSFTRHATVPEPPSKQLKMVNFPLWDEPVSPTICLNFSAKKKKQIKLSGTNFHIG
ncbi:hypothetical protein Hanom_Chr00s004927g01727021 [Helianthus anomalus]